MSDKLVRLIDIAIFPVALIICAKVLGLVITNSWFGLDWGFVTNNDSIYSVRIAYPTPEQKILAASFSNLIMYSIVLIGVVVSLIQAYFFHASHISPKMMTRLIQHDLVHLVSESLEIFQKSSVWIILLWISSLIIVLSTLSGDTYLWIAILTSVLTIVLTILLAKDIEHELKLKSD